MPRRKIERTLEEEEEFQQQRRHRQITKLQNNK